MITKENQNYLKQIASADGVLQESEDDLRGNNNSAFILEVAIASLASDSNFIRTLVDNIPNPIFIVQLNSAIKYANPALERLTGYSTSELIGSKAPYPWWPQEMLERYQNESATGEKMELNHLERSFRKKNGEQFWANVKIQALKQGDGVRYFLGIWEDLTERKLAESKLEEAIKEWKNTFDSISDLVSVHDKECRVIKVNRAYAKVFNKTPEELVGQFCYSQIHGTRCPIAGCPHQETLRSGELATANYYEPKLGFYLEVTTSPIYDSKGEIMGSIHIAKDISERKTMEERLSRVQEFNTQILVHAPNPVMVISGDHSIQYVNPAFERLTGFSEREILGNKPPFSYWPIEKMDEYKLDFSNAEITYSERQFIKKNGERFWVRLASVPVGEEGIVKYHLVNWADVTELKLAQEKLRKSEEKYSTIVEKGNDGIIVLQDGAIKFANSMMEEMTNFPHGEATGKQFIEFIPQRFRELVINRYQRRISGEEVPAKNEISILTKDGKEIPVEVNANQIDFEGRPASMAIIRDITQRKEAEAALAHRASFPEFNTSLIIEITLDGNISYVNPSARSVFRDIEKQAGEHPYLAGWAEVVEQLRKSDCSNLRREVRIEQEHFEQNIQLLPQFNALRFYGTNITERKRAEERIRESQANYSNLFESMTQGVVYHDRESRVTSINPAALNVLGFSPAQVLHASLLDSSLRFFHEDGSVLPVEEHPVILALRTGLAIKDVLIGMLNPRKEKFHWLNISAIPEFLPEDQEKPWRVFTTFTDLTDRKEASDKLKQAQKDLQDSLHQTRTALEDSIDIAARMVEIRDPYTAGHQRRVANLSIAIARELQLPSDQIDYLDLAAKVHDIGKIHVPAEILSKTGRLTDLEFQIMKTHAKGGYDVLNGVDFPWPLAQIILQHHERMDGSGYPNGLKGDEILLEARIIAVADTVEAMSGHRPYRPSLGMEEAIMQIKRNSDKLYDSQVVEVCVNLIENKGFHFES